MTITNARYTATGAITATINEQEMTIPDDMGNRHRKMLEDANVSIEAYVAPPTTAEQIRAERNGLLTASDWTQVADAPVDQAAWATYRQALRDVPEQNGFPTDVVWPEKP